MSRTTAESPVGFPPSYRVEPPVTTSARATQKKPIGSFEVYAVDTEPVRDAQVFICNI